MYNYTKARVFISENTADLYQILIIDRGDGSDDDYVEFVREHITGSLTMANFNREKGKDGMFAPACKAHCLQYDTPIKSAPWCCCSRCTRKTIFYNLILPHAPLLSILVLLCLSISASLCLWSHHTRCVHVRALVWI